MHAPFNRRTRGFSLVELLIALVFISFMMAGMLRVYGSAIQGFSAANETAKAQRDNRTALSTLSDDLQTAGYFYYYTGRPSTSGIYVGPGTSVQNPLMLLPSQVVTVATPTDPTNPGAGVTNEKLTFDEIQFLRDEVLPVTGQLAAQPTSQGSISVTLTNGDLSSVKRGDFVVLLDSAPYQMIPIIADAPAGTSGTLQLSTAVVQDPTTGAIISSSVLNLSHQAGVDVAFVRPYQVVRYTLLPMALDPSNTSATLPCLVRDETAYPGTGTSTLAPGSLITWPAPTATAAQAATAGVTRTLVAENVSGLFIDMSLDQGLTWARGADWGGTQTNLNNQLSNLNAKYTGLGYATTTLDSSNPLWYRNAPLLFRADVTTRTVLKRADYAATANTSAYRTRTQTVMVQPRNFGLGI